MWFGGSGWRLAGVNGSLSLYAGDSRSVGGLAGPFGLARGHAGTRARGGGGIRRRRPGGQRAPTAPRAAHVSATPVAGVGLRSLLRL